VLYGREGLPVTWTARWVVVISAVLCGGCLDEYASRYSNVDEVVRSGAVARGWVPDILPKDAVDIREVHNLDTNETWGCFITPGGVEQVRSRLQELGAKRESGPAPHEGRGPSWWPTAQPDEWHSVREDAGRVLKIRLDVATKQVCFSRNIA
jgi:hypothetical protein